MMRLGWPSRRRGHVARRRIEPSGIIRESAPTAIALPSPAPPVPALLAHHPRIHVQEDDVTMRRLGASRLIFVANPGSVDANARVVHPKSPEATLHEFQ